MPILQTEKNFFSLMIPVTLDNYFSRRIIYGASSCVIFHRLNQSCLQDLRATFEFKSAPIIYIHSIKLGFWK